ncbi:MAG: TIGR02117 family protein [Bacteroidota bacterium]
MIHQNKKSGFKWSYIKRPFNWFFRFVIFFLGAVLLYVLFAVLLAFIPVNQDFKTDPHGVEIFIATNGVHLDICLPVESPEFSWLDFFENNPLPLRPQGYLAFGWGDRDFYINTPEWSDLTLSTALNSTLLPSRSVMHVTAYSYRLKLSESVRSVRISTESYAKLVQYVQNSFAKDQQGKLQALNCCTYTADRDLFFEAKGSYHLFRTCNDWANSSLKHAGVRTAFWSPFDWGVLRYFEE